MSRNDRLRTGMSALVQPERTSLNTTAIVSAAPNTSGVTAMLQTEPGRGRTILIVEDDVGLRSLIGKNLKRAGFRTDFARSGAEAIEKVGAHQCALVLLDYQLPDMTGREVVEKLAGMQQLSPFVVMTGRGDEKTAVEMMKLGARDYIVKNTSFMDILPQVVGRVVKELDSETRLGEAEERLRESQRAVAQLMSNLPGMAYRCLSDRHRTMIYVSQGCMELTGYEPSDLVGDGGMPYIKLVHADDRRMVLGEIQTALQDRRPFRLTYRTRTRGGEQKWVWEKGSGVYSSDGSWEAVEGFMTDITERKQAEAAVLEHTTQLETLFGIGVALSQTLNLEDMLDSVLERLLDSSAAEGGGVFLRDKRTLELVLRAHRGLSEDFAHGVGKLKTGRRRAAQAGGRGKRTVVSSPPEGPELAAAAFRSEGFRAVASVPIVANETMLGVLCVGSRTAREFPAGELRLLDAVAGQIGLAVENAQLYERTAEFAFTDSLTGLYNRRYLVDQLERESARAGRSGCALALVMMDLDGLKEVNDRFGHHVGDAFIVEFSRIIKASTRASDVVARWGGDEFVLLAPESCGDRALQIGERIRSRLERYRMDVGGEEVGVSVSIGVASYPQDTTDATALLGLADEAMYAAKRAGKNQVCVLSSGEAGCGVVKAVGR